MITRFIAEFHWNDFFHTILNCHSEENDSQVWSGFKNNASMSFIMIT